ncbi:Crp/Fnr family transcriptional regulator [Thiofilum flexile]|uniref:Crp/Fnr family transcriptional regulator n=1 Tax=Thiofilum flexile TaxID=125627 RepID=UPI0004765C99|nr:Crp/Fnr family transcriptional regulator [Thiofilum flexile]
MLQQSGSHSCQSCQVRHLSILSRMSTERLGQIAQDFNPSVITFGGQDTIYYQGDSARYAYTVRSGFVKLLSILPNGRTHIVRVLHTGDLLGFEGIVGGKYAHTAMALTKVDVCRFALSELMALKQNYAEVDGMLTQRWIQSLTKAEDMLVELGAKKTGERLGAFLVRWCESAPKGIEGWVPLPLSRAEVGELLGMTVETVSRALSEWKRQGLFQERGGFIRLPDVERLCATVCNISRSEVLNVG